MARRSRWSEEKVLKSVVSAVSPVYCWKPSEVNHLAEWMRRLGISNKDSGPSFNVPSVREQTWVPFVSVGGLFQWGEEKSVLNSSGAPGPVLRLPSYASSSSSPSTLSVENWLSPLPSEPRLLPACLRTTLAAAAPRGLCAHFFSRPYSDKCRPSKRDRGQSKAGCPKLTANQDTERRAWQKTSGHFWREAIQTLQKVLKYCS